MENFNERVTDSKRMSARAKKINNKRLDAMHWLHYEFGHDWGTLEKLTTKKLLELSELENKKYFK